MTVTTENGFLTTKQVAELLRVDIGKVSDWINAGSLIAVNVATASGGIRPRWRISRESLAQFLASRQSQSSSTPTRRQSAKSTGQYY